MSLNWKTLLLSVLGGLLLRLVLIGAQVFEQPATTTTTTTTMMKMTNVVYTTYIKRAGGGATQLPNPVNAERGATHIIKAAELQEFMNGDALEPLLQQLLRKTVPNWQQEQPQQQQTPQQQQQQQQHQQFFVYENSEPVQLASQQPQILAGFNGVNVRQQQSKQRQQPQSTTMRQQQQQQFTQLPLPIQMQQQPAEQQEYTQYLQITPKIALAPPATATAATTTAATWPPAVGFVAPIGTSANSFQPPSPEASNATDALCQRCCDPSEAPQDTPCACCKTKPLLSAALLKSTAG